MRIASRAKSAATATVMGSHMAQFPVTHARVLVARSSAGRNCRHAIQESANAPQTALLTFLVHESVCSICVRVCMSRDPWDLLAWLATATPERTAAVAAGGTGEEARHAGVW